MYALLAVLGVPNMALDQLLILLALVVVVTLIMGWMSDAVLGAGGYGVLLNSAVMLAGAIGGVLLWRKLGLHMTVVSIRPLLATALVAVGSGMVLLLACIVARRWI